MKYGIHSSQSVSYERLARLLKISKRIKKPFSDYDIIELQDTFLTPGFHYIRVNSIKNGRAFIHTFLKSLNCYREIACLTTHPTPLPNSIFDLYHELISQGFLTTTIKKDLDEFFIELYIDFLWIEATKQLLQIHWFDALEQKIIDLHMDKKIPIMMLTYDV